MARRSKQKGSRSKSLEAQASKTVHVKGDKHHTASSSHSRDAQDLIHSSAITNIQNNINPKQTPSFAKKTDSENVVHQPQTECQHCSTQPVTLKSELSSMDSSLQILSLDSSQSLINNCTIPMDSSSTNDTLASHCKSEQSVDCTHQVFDLPKSIDSMLKAPPTILGTIGILPPEIRNIIFQDLSWESARNLAAANKYYRGFINPDNYGGRTDWVKFLRSQEENSLYNSSKKGKSQFACTGCWRLKLEKRFCISQITGIGLRKGGKSWRKRRCLACEIKEGRYQASDEIANGVDRIMKLCRACGEFRSGYHCAQCNLCEGCFGGFVGDRCPRCHGYLIEPGKVTPRYFMRDGTVQTSAWESALWQ